MHIRYFIIFLMSAVVSTSVYGNDSTEIRRFMPFYQHGKWGYYNSENGQVIIAPRYDWAELPENGAAKVTNHNLYGLVDTNGAELLPCKYAQFFSCDDANLGIPPNFLLIGNGVYNIPQKKWELPDDGKDSRYDFFPDGKGGSAILLDRKALYYEGKKMPAPRGYRISQIDFDRKWLYLQQYDVPAGICDWDGKWIIPANQYFDIQILGKTAPRVVAVRPKHKIFSMAGLQQIVEQSKNGKDMVLTDIYDLQGKLLKTIASKDQPDGDIRDSDLISYTQNGADRQLNLATLQESAPEAEKEELADEKNGFITFKNGDNWGIKDTTGKIYIQPEYHSIAYSNSNNILVSVQNLVSIQNVGSYAVIKYGVINIQGKTIIPIEYEILDRVFNPSFIGYSIRDASGKYALWDTAGKPLTPFKYDYPIMGNATNAAASGMEVSENYKKGIIDSKGKEFVPCKYDYIMTNDENFYIVQINNLWGVLDSAGNEMLPVKSTDYPFVRNDGWVNFTVDSVTEWHNLRTGLVLKGYRELSPRKYVIFGLKENGFDILNKNGELLGSYDHFDDNGTNGNLLVQKGEDYWSNWGMLNEKGETVIPLEYNKLYFVKYPYLLAQKGEDYFYMDASGKIYKL